jgi:hypothetical protein
MATRSSSALNVQTNDEGDEDSSTSRSKRREKTPYDPLISLVVCILVLCAMVAHPSTEKNALSRLVSGWSLQCTVEEFLGLYMSKFLGIS